MSDAFQEAYRRLNDAQREAVEEIDGPVLVVAGPGTGKTQLLSVRVANILKKTDVDAGGILCVTFTNFAATNMRDRLFGLIGPASHNVVVRTFHSFAAELMNQYPDYFWSGASLSVAPDAVQLETIESILAALPLDNPLASTFAGAFTALGDIQEALRLAKEAGLTPDKLRAIIAANTAYIDQIEPAIVDLLSPALSFKKLDNLQAQIDKLPDQAIDEAIAPLVSLGTVIKDSLRLAIQLDEPLEKTTNTGKWKQRWLQTIEGKKGMFSERARNDWWLAVADVYEQYRDELHTRGYYDYADMIVEVITQLEQHADMRADVQERYQYVLIDEFQDTNAAQLRLANLVADSPSSNGRPNLMAVGDDDQSIFAFNGAELDNLLSFRRSYPSAKVVVLKENYRSTPAVLSAASTVIEQADDRLVRREADIEKSLVAAADIPDGRLEHRSYPTREHQLTEIAALIKARRDDGESDIAVLARNHDSLKQMASLLLEAGVPVRYEQRRNILDSEALQQLYAIAAAAVAINKGDRGELNLQLSRTLSHPMWGISGRALWRLALDNYAEPRWLESLLDHDDENLQAIGHWLTWLARGVKDTPLPLMVEYLLGLRYGQYLKSPIYEHFIEKRSLDSDYLETLSAVEVLCRMVQEFSAPKGATLADFVRFVDLSRSTKRVITDESWFASDERAVQLMTIFKAKGLEFDSVFLIDAIEDNWRPRPARRKSPANLPLQSYGEKFDDYVRLLYVALTRARKTFIASSYLNGPSGQKLLPSPLLSVALPPQEQPPKELAPSTITLQNALRWPRLQTSDERALLQGRLEDYCLSPSGLIDFLNIIAAGPQYFLDKHLLRLPSANTPVQAYGKAVHAALETTQRLVNDGHYRLDTVLDRYEAALKAESLPPLEYERYLTRGEGVLRQLLEERGYRPPKGSIAEQNLFDVPIGEARTGGRLDRVDKPEDKHVIIVDYKTGEPLTNLQTKDKTKVVKAWRHRMQLAFYAMLVARSRRFGAPSRIECQIVYVEAQDQKHMYVPFAVDQALIERLEGLVQAVWPRIMALDFPDTNRYPSGLEGILAFETDLLNGEV